MNFSPDENEYGNDQFPFDLPEDDQGPAFPDPGGGGISPIFKIIGAVTIIVVLIIVVVLVIVAMGNSGPSDRDKEATKIAEANETAIAGNNATATSWQVALDATGTAIAVSNQHATETSVAVTQAFFQGQTATSAAVTAEFHASETAAASATAAQEAADAAATAEADARTVHGFLVLPDNTALGNTQVYLFRDNGDRIFSAEDVAMPTPVPTIAPTIDVSSVGPISQTETAIAIQAPPLPQPTLVTVPTGEPTLEPGGDLVPTAEIGAMEPGPALVINYGDNLAGTLDAQFLSRWLFTGAAGDVITIRANPASGTQTDILLALIGPDGATLEQMGAGDPNLGAEITNFELPASGQYTIQVSTQTVPGDYQISLVGQSTTSMNIIVGGGRFGNPRQGNDKPTPEPTSITGDEFLDSVLTDPNTGEFIFNNVEPGIYWLVIDFSALPADLQTQILDQNPNPPLQIPFMVNVPLQQGEPITMTIDPAVLSVSEETPETPVGTEDVEANGFVTLTSTPEVTGTIFGPTAIAQTGIFAGDGGIDDAGAGGLTVLAIAALGLVAVVFIARKLRTS